MSELGTNACPADFEIQNSPGNQTAPTHCGGSGLGALNFDAIGQCLCVCVCMICYESTHSLGTYQTSGYKHSKNTMTVAKRVHTHKRDETICQLSTPQPRPTSNLARPLLPPPLKPPTHTTPSPTHPTLHSHTRLPNPQVGPKQYMIAASALSSHRLVGSPLAAMKRSNKGASQKSNNGYPTILARYKSWKLELGRCPALRSRWLAARSR